MISNLIQKFENLSILFNMGNFFSREIKHNEFSILFNDKLPDDPYLNYVTKIKVKGNVNRFITEMESKFIEHKSKPCFYLLSYSLPKILEKILTNKGYKPFTTDAWMFFNLKKNVAKTEKPVKAKKIGKSKLAEFKNVFNEVYMKGEEDDPYKNLSHLYGEFMVRRFLKKNNTCKTEHFAVFSKNKMIGIIAMVHDRKVAGLYALAVLPDYRKMGAGKALLSACILRAKELKLSHLFLNTEKNSRNEKIFKKLGFKTEFVAKQFYKP